MSRAKGWAYTSFAVDTIPVYDAARMKYMCFGLESCPDTGRPHYQGYVLYKTRVSLNTAQRCLGLSVCHMEVARGSPWQNREYCQKDGEFMEWGDVPKTKERAILAAHVIEALQSQKTLGDLFKEHPDAALRYVSQFQKIRGSIIEPFDGPRDILWFYGPTGTGKTRHARELLPTAPMVTLDGLFVHGYTGETSVIIDEFRLRDANWAGLLRYTDRYPVFARVLFGCIGWACRQVVITSPMHPRDLPTGGGEDNVDQILRRLRGIVRFYGSGEHYVEAGCCGFSDAGCTGIVGGAAMI